MDMIRILAVDDEPDLRSLLRILLKNKGYEVLEAASGQEAVEKVRSEPRIDLVIMDIIVETVDGSVVNVEVQKIGYNFPGERAACYNADLLLRQYQRIRKEYSENDTLEQSGKRVEKKAKFSYKYIRPV